MSARIKIWREGGFVENDPWVIETEDVKAGEGEKVILPLADFIAAAEASNDAGLGVLIDPADDVTALAPYIDRIGIVAARFPAFNDGRAFSHATLLRERLNYRNEIRAVGDVLIDQVPLMLRCGFDSFAVINATAIERLAQNRLPGIDVYYQPAARPSDRGPGYSWRRRIAAA